MSATLQDSPPRPKLKPSRKAFWTRQIVLWHWVSSSVCLGGLVLFTVTGVTLNHAAEIGSTPAVSRREAAAPATVLPSLQAQEGEESRRPLPADVAAWLTEAFEIRIPAGAAEWSQEEIYVSLPRPGGDAWIAIDRASGAAELEETDRGWVAYLNDLHKGRHTGPAWAVFIDVLAAACLIFALTGVFLLQVHAAKRPATWPVVALGFVAPVLLLMLFVHG